MEDTLRADDEEETEEEGEGLNPCFNGRYSQSSILSLETWVKKES